MITVAHHNEPDLVAGLRQGEERSFTLIYDHFYQRVYFFALRFVSSADAKDITSEAFIKLWQKREDFDRFDAISHFLFVLVRNRCYDLMRHELVKTNKHAELLHQLDTSEENDLFLEQVKAELICHIYAEVDRLPQKMKAIVLLSFSEGLKPAEIAQRLNLSVQTVSNQKLTAIRLLKAALGHRAMFLSMLILLHSEG